MSKKRVIRLSKLEKVLYSGAFLSMLFTVTLQIFMGATLGNSAIVVEKIKRDIVVQEKQNESLTMQVNELTAFNNVKDVVKEMGLAYNNDNIIIVD